MQDQERALGLVAERVASFLTTAGMQRMQARVLTSLMTSEFGRLTSKELQERLQVSAAAVSGAVRSLESIGLLHRITEPGNRREVYALPEDTWYSATTRVDRLYLSIAQHLQDAIDTIGTHHSARRARLQEMADFFSFMARRLPELMSEWDQVRLGVNGRTAPRSERPLRTRGEDVG